MPEPATSLEVVVAGTKEEKEDIEEVKVVIKMQKHIVQLLKSIFLEAIQMSSVIILVLEEATLSEIEVVRGSLTKERSSVTIVINLDTLPMNAGRLTTTMPIENTRRMIRHTWHRRKMDLIQIKFCLWLPRAVKKTTLPGILTPSARTT